MKMNRYEIHTTIDEHSNRNRVADISQWLKDNADPRKVLDIILSRGRFPNQLMFGWHGIFSCATDAIHAAGKFQGFLEASNFVVTRSKVEGHPDNDISDAKNFLYFEAHWKIKKVEHILPSHLLLSYNREQPEIEYVTLRQRQGTYMNFSTKYEALTALLEPILLKKPHMEVAVYDSNISLDRGWDPFA
jgi:hypothetical protein